jgi:hypothetical protein
LKNDIEFWIVIPTANRHEYLEEIFECSGVSPEQIVLIRTTPGQTISGAVNLWVSGDINIQRWWNTGIQYCRNNGGRYVAILNDDTVLRKGDLQKLLQQLKAEGTTLVLPVAKGNAGWGHCWILDTAHNVYPDERFQWWCGDHDLEIRALKAKGVAYLPLQILNKHANELTTENLFLQTLTRKDIRTFRRKYPGKALAEFYRRFNRKFFKV